MNIGMQKATQPSDIRWGAYRLGLHGSILDERGKVAVDEMRDKVDELLALRYDPHSFEVTFDAERVEVDSLTETLRARLSGQTLLETTTLGFVEMLLCCRTLRQVGADSLPWCTTPIEADSSLGPDSHHPIISLSGIPSAVMVLRILHPILASTLCAANPLARIAEPTIAL